MYPRAHPLAREGIPIPGGGPADEIAQQILGVDVDGDDVLLVLVRQMRNEGRLQQERREGGDTFGVTAAADAPLCRRTTSFSDTPSITGPPTQPVACLAMQGGLWGGRDCKGVPTLSAMGCVPCRCCCHGQYTPPPGPQLPRTAAGPSPTHPPTRVWFGVLGTGDALWSVVCGLWSVVCGL